METFLEVNEQMNESGIKAVVGSASLAFMCDMKIFSI